MKGISVVIPAYNESGVIFKTAEETVSAMSELGIDFEVIVVDDGSTDDTLEEIRRAADCLHRVSWVSLPENRGKGHALKRGAQAASMDLVCFLDADLDLHPSNIKSLLEARGRSGADVVIGSKRHPESRLNYPKARKIYSAVYYLLILLLFRLPLKDTQTGVKLFDREVLARVMPRMVSKKYALDLELMVVVHRMGFTIDEAPIELSFKRTFGRISWADIRGIIVDTMAIFYRCYILGYYDSPMKPVTEKEPSVSIVIPTKEIDDCARECVSRCLEMDYSRFDIKLVPDREAEYGSGVSRLSVIPSGDVGPAVKRNLGVEQSDAEIVAFIDADAWPEYDWLRNAIPYFDEEGTAGVGGPMVTPDTDNYRRQASGMIYACSMVSGSTTYRYTYHALREVDDYPTCNLLVRRGDFDKVGGFEEDYWPGEDTILCLKLTKELGKRIVYVPNVVVNHHRREVYAAHLRQVFSYALHRGYFVRKFPQTSRRLQYFVPTVFLFTLVAGLVAGLLVRPVLWVYLGLLGTYAIMVAASSVKSMDIPVDLMVGPGIFLTHLAYGWGFLKGLLSRGMKEQ